MPLADHPDQSPSPSLGDTLFEANETYTVTLSGAAGAAIVTPSATGTITNDDTRPVISVNDVSVAEGNAGSLNAIFTVGLSAASGLDASAIFATADATATAGSDYTAVSTTVTIPAGSTSVTVNVPVLGDTLAEADETFAVALSGLAGATAGDLAGVGTIVNDELLSLSIGPVAVAEGNAGDRRLRSSP